MNRYKFINEQTKNKYLNNISGFKINDAKNQIKI